MLCISFRFDGPRTYGLSSPVMSWTECLLLLDSEYDQWFLFPLLGFSVVSDPEAAGGAC